VGNFRNTYDFTQRSLTLRRSPSASLPGQYFVAIFSLMIATKLRIFVVRPRKLAAGNNQYADRGEVILGDLIYARQWVAR
jgi:hypothetical protein